MATPTKKSSAAVSVSGRGARLLSTSRSDLFIVRVGGRVAKTPPDQTAGPLLRKVGRALSQPGIRREAVFGQAPKKTFYAYSLDPTNVERMIREDGEGNKTVGRMVDGKFRKVTASA